MVAKYVIAAICGIVAGGLGIAFSLHVESINEQEAYKAIVYWSFAYACGLLSGLRIR